MDRVVVEAWLDVVVRGWLVVLAGGVVVLVGGVVVVVGGVVVVSGVPVVPAATGAASSVRVAERRSVQP